MQGGIQDAHAYSMSVYERTLSIEAPADEVFTFLSNAANFEKISPDLRTAQVEAEGGRLVKWNSAGGNAASGSILVEPGDVAPEFCEIKLTVSKDHAVKSDTPSPQDEQMLQWMDDILHKIQKQVEPKGGTGSSFS